MMVVMKTEIRKL